MLQNFIIQKYFRKEDEILVQLGSVTQKGAIFTAIKTSEFWKELTLKDKLKAIFTRRWIINNESVKTRASGTFDRLIFGTEKDYGDKLKKLMIWHNSKQWELSYLEEEDAVRASGLNGQTILSRLKFSKTSDHLSLKLFDHAPFVCLLVHPMIVKFPVQSIQYYLDLHVEYSFNSIRKSNHKFATDLIAYLYEILLLQQKTATSIHELFSLISKIQKHKGDASLTENEMNFIKVSELLFSYLKASVEKIIVFTGLIYENNTLDSKNKHAKKISALLNSVPANVKELGYYKFLISVVDYQSIDELNEYRTGILHKKGISILQPHNYIDKDGKAQPLVNVFFTIHERHAQNTAALISSLALLTDELVKLDPPEISFSEIPV